MSILYRVISEKVWLEAQKTGRVPRCGNDGKLDCVHLNLEEAVETIAARYFKVEEHPLVLEVDVTSFENKIEWLDATPDDPWKQPRAKIQNLHLKDILKVHSLEPSLKEGGLSYRLIKK